MRQRVLSLIAVGLLTGAAALVPTSASAVDSVQSEVSLRGGVTFSSASAAVVPVTYTCANLDTHVSTEDLHVRATQSVQVVAEGDVAITCDGVEREVDVGLVVEVGDFQNGTAYVDATVGSTQPHPFEDVAVTGVPERPQDPELAVVDQAVRFSSATQASVVVSYRCGIGAAGGARDTYLHVTVYQRKGTATEAIAGSDGVVPVVCDAQTRTTPTVPLTVQTGTFVDTQGADDAEAWLSVDGEPTVVVQPVAVRDVPVADTRADVTLTVNARPEPAVKGRTITVEGVVRRSGKAYAKKKVVLEFQPDGEEYAAVKTVTSSSKGALKTTVKATRSGSFRWTSSATTSTKAGASTGDHVEVKAAPKPLPKPKAYKNCTALRHVYPHGVGKKGARDHTSGDPVTTFTVDSKTYAKNTKSDRDKDGIACEQA